MWVLCLLLQSLYFENCPYLQYLFCWLFVLFYKKNPTTKIIPFFPFFSVPHFVLIRESVSLFLLLCYMMLLKSVSPFSNFTSETNLVRANYVGVRLTYIARCLSCRVASCHRGAQYHLGRLFTKLKKWHNGPFSTPPRVQEILARSWHGTQDIASGGHSSRDWNGNFVEKICELNFLLGIKIKFV